ncbi:MAG TPA: SGNH/GDSL hydrolase family protein [Candidatus Marinimicrobia bacterium]|nr:SGNH/GDSL hydrolase family protein [Candidatus Neomarinimicrobiota bacterium]
MIIRIIALSGVLIIILIVAITYTLIKAQKLPLNSPVNFLEDSAQDKNKKTVVCVGNSITHGQVSYNYVNILSERLSVDGYQFVNAGINGNLAYNVVNRLDKIIGCDPDYVTVLIGTNDANASLSKKNSARYMKDMALPEKPNAEFFRKNLKELISQLKKRTNAKIAILSLPPIGEDINHIAYQRTKEYSGIILDVAQENNVDYLPLHEKITEYLLAEDHHPRLSYDNGFRRIMIRGIFSHFLLRTSFDKIATNNGFLIVTDFLHLNHRGSKMVADLIKNWILK